MFLQFDSPGGFFLYRSKENIALVSVDIRTLVCVKKAAVLFVLLDDRCGAVDTRTYACVQT